jgi:hypothetical protein
VAKRTTPQHKTPEHKLIVLPWLKSPMQRFVLANWTAITIGRRIFAWRNLDRVELAHELKHVEQWQRYGISFVVLYWMASRNASRSGGNRYFDNKFEKEAVAAADAERKRLASM